LILIIVVLSASAFGLFVDREKQRILETVDRAELQFSKASQQMAGFRALQPTERLAHLKEAKRLATSVLVEDESNFRAWLIRARVHHRLEDWKNALYDLDRAADLLTEPREDILRYRIDTLQNTNKPSARRRLMEDLRTLLRIDKSPDTLCIVADYMLRFAAVTSDPRNREDLLARVEEMLDRIAEPNGPAAIARAQVLFLRGKKDAARGAAAQACIDFYGNPLVHEEAARVYRGLGKLEVARGEESSEDLPGPRPGPPAGKLDTGSLRSWLEDLGRLFGEEAKGKTGEPRK
jgi:tetratricopeptide (TPR) repeat protein